MATRKVPAEIQLNSIWVVELQDITNNPFEEWYVWSVYPRKERAELSCKLSEDFNALGGMTRYQTRTRMTRVPFNLESDGKYTPCKPKKGRETFWVIRVVDNNSMEDYDIFGVYSSEEKARIGLANVMLNTKPPERRCTVQVDFRIEEHSIDQC
jgi:hypothetical protein